MKLTITCGLLILLLVTPFCYSTTMYSVIPQPVNLQPQEGVFTIHPSVIIAADEPASSLGSTLNKMLSAAAGFDLKIVHHTEQKKDLIQLQLEPSLKSALGSEGYRLIVSQEQIHVQAAEKQGLYYGLVTLKQLLPQEIYSQTKVDKIAWNVPCVKIEDYPRFQWRGMHLDVCRFFMPKEFVKKYIDLIALHKMNVFHWHLTEDQGWRIEIKKYPKLTEVGAWRNGTVDPVTGIVPDSDKKPYGGFYTRDEIREVVAYAKERFVTIVPEIEMPGHCQAALAAYPELGNYGKQLPVATTRGGYGDDVFNVEESTLLFLQDVLTEVMDLFPSAFIHIGGDEVPKYHWENNPQAQARMKERGLNDANELQSWFIKQMDTFLAERGRRLIGWDEILEGGLAPGAAVMSWRGAEGGIAAAKAGHDVVMAPTSHTYFDYYQAEPASEPLAIGGFLPLEKVYRYEPIPDTLTKDQAKHILGAQGQLWTEFMPTAEDVEYMALPRMCALAEVVWTPAEKKAYDNFRERLGSHTKRLEILSVNFRPLSKTK